MSIHPANAQDWEGREVSLARQTSDIFAEITDLFGPRDESWTFAGWEFRPDGPVIYFPRPGERHVVIRLSMYAAGHWNTAVHELAHECVHLLSPVTSPPATSLEEGVASWYAHDFYRRATGRDPGEVRRLYREAHEAVEALFGSTEDGPRVIRRLREVEPSFSRITQVALLAAAPAFDPVGAAFLCRLHGSL